MDLRYYTDKGYEQLPSQQAIKSVQGANQTREDVRLDISRRKSMTRRISAVAAFGYNNKIAPQNGQVCSHK